jgi:hypothetical protein
MYVTISFLILKAENDVQLCQLPKLPQTSQQVYLHPDEARGAAEGAGERARAGAGEGTEAVESAKRKTYLRANMV